MSDFPWLRTVTLGIKTPQQQPTVVHVEKKLTKKTSSIVGGDMAGRQKRMGMGAQRMGGGVGMEFENDWAATTMDGSDGPFDPW